MNWAIFVNKKKGRLRCDKLWQGLFPASMSYCSVLLQLTDSFFWQSVRSRLFLLLKFCSPFLHVCWNCDPLVKSVLRLDVSHGEFGHSWTRADSIVTSLGLSCHTMWHSGLLWLTHFDQWDYCSLLSVILAGTRVVTGLAVSCGQQVKITIFSWILRFEALQVL